MSESNVLLNLQTTWENLDHARQVLMLSTSFPRDRKAFPDNSLRLAAFMASRIARDERRYALEIEAIRVTLRVHGFKQSEMAEALPTIAIDDLLVKVIRHADGRFETQTFAERLKAED